MKIESTFADRVEALEWADQVMRENSEVTTFVEVSRLPPTYEYDGDELFSYRCTVHVYPTLRRNNERESSMGGEVSALQG